MHLQLNPETKNAISANPGLDPDLFKEEFCSLLGLPESIPTSVIINQLTGETSPSTPENQEKINFLLALVASQNPGSLLEAQLLMQMMSAHQLCTEMMQKASSERWPENIDSYVNIAMKLSRGYKNGLETLAKYRRNGKQYMHIEHIHVEKDANAIIGKIDRG
jgi:hypothetical protein